MVRPVVAGSVLKALTTRSRHEPATVEEVDPPRCRVAIDESFTFLPDGVGRIACRVPTTDLLHSRQYADDAAANDAAVEFARSLTHEGPAGGCRRHLELLGEVGDNLMQITRTVAGSASLVRGQLPPA